MTLSWQFEVKVHIIVQKYVKRNVLQFIQNHWVMNRKQYWKEKEQSLECLPNMRGCINKASSCITSTVWCWIQVFLTDADDLSSPVNFTNNQFMYVVNSSKKLFRLCCFSTDVTNKCCRSYHGPRTKIQRNLSSLLVYLQV